MRPQGFGQIGAGLEDLGWNDMGFEPPKPSAANRDETHDAFGEEVVEHPLLNGHAGLTPVDSPVHSQQARIVDTLNGATDEGEEADETAELVDEAQAQAQAQAEAEAEVEPKPIAAAVPIRAVAPVQRRAPTPRCAPGSKAKAAFTLRLDPERHLRLRLACAVRGQSAQLLVTDALDRLLADMPELDAMAAKAKRKE